MGGYALLFDYIYVLISNFDAVEDVARFIENITIVDDYFPAVEDPKPTFLR